MIQTAKKTNRSSLGNNCLQETSNALRNGCLLKHTWNTADDNRVDLRDAEISLLWLCTEEYNRLT